MLLTSILAGDFNQLPPVKDSLLYKKPIETNKTKISLNTIREEAYGSYTRDFSKVVILRENMRLKTSHANVSELKKF